MKRILIIEDDESHRRMLTAVLMKANYEVVSAPNGFDGCEIYRNTTCDLVISDIFMPEQEGLETITALKEEFPEAKIIAISGGGVKSNYVAKDILEIAKDLGANLAIAKPIQIPELLKQISKLIGR
jgi:CheY-like chemotaxis protein